METQTIREVERPVISRLRGIWPRKRVDPLHETAEGLGIVLDKLSYSVTESAARRYDPAGDDFEGGEFAVSRRTRGFKLHGFQSVEAVAMEDAAEPETEPAVPAVSSKPAAPAATSAPAAPVAASTPATPVAASVAASEPEAPDTEPVTEAALDYAAEAIESAAPITSEERAEALNILKEARNVAAEAVAPPVVMPAHERAAAQEKLLELFYELNTKRAEIVSAVFSGSESPESLTSLFTLSTPANAKAAYNGIDAMIMKFLNAGKGEEADGAGGANTIYSGHEAAISATEQLKNFLVNEGPEKAFSRFREVNRANILGLLM